MYGFIIIINIIINNIIIGNKQIIYTEKEFRHSWRLYRSQVTMKI